MKRFISILGLCLILIGCSSSTATQTNGVEVETEKGNANETIEIETQANEDENSADQIFNLTGENFKFIMNGIDNPDIRVKEGETVLIHFKSTQGFHDWAVDEFEAATDQVQKDGETSVTFLADKKGTFEYYCSVGDHRERGMKGVLIVE